MTRLGADHDLYSAAGKAEVQNILETTGAQVAQVYLDYDGNKEGNHFIIAYKNPEGKWILKDHNMKEGSKVGNSLEDAIKKGQIKDIRLVYPK
ncbi:hypothetical protein LEP1GSC195_1862 [Leptospira wolbachii serovar Codice str. CDC]|uniref:Uncharacterized protein n=1 Tax=Leptospira wolbachii serovar Codice str. CDC TaxID=1218599 RepID=R9A4Y7_9LEPT|nr:hypothetical protein [Leptospira wolbachii]EOQ97177.1 hypothetical protein LEP1GSC195_1862 [Leptospira wolbachii serovar Codice str. CDC]